MPAPISIVIPTKNRRLLLERAIKSILAQSEPPAEIVVVNDGSTDETPAYLGALSGSMPALKAVNFETSGGVNVARNTGVRNAVSEWIAFLDDDDEFVPEAVALMSRAIKEYGGEADALFFNAIASRNGGVTEETGYMFAPGEKIHRATYEDFISKKGLKGDMRMIVNRRVFQGPQGYFPEWINGYESFYLTRAVRNGARFVYVNARTCVMHFEHAQHHGMETFKYSAAYLRAMNEFVKENEGYLRGDRGMLAYCLLRIGRLHFYLGERAAGFRYVFKAFMTRPSVVLSAIGRKASLAYPLK